MILNNSKIAVVIPCYNEEQTIAGVVRDFQSSLPEATIYVFDNASLDRTAEKAAEAGAVVVHSMNRGKGAVIQHIFREVDADWYMMVDGDSTYDASRASDLLLAARESDVDMVIGRRVTPPSELGQAYRPMHQFGNRLVCGLIQWAFGQKVGDIFSGYRVFSRNFAKTVPLSAKGFDIELEMTLQALSKGYALAEVEVAYSSRPEGSLSKLDTYTDGAIVLLAFVRIFRDYRPGLFFASLGAFLALLSLTAGFLPVMEYWQHQYVYRVPLALLATGFAVLSALSFSIGLILQTQLRYHNETYRLLGRLMNVERRP